MNILRTALAVVMFLVASSIPAAALTIRRVTDIVIPTVDFRDVPLVEAVEYFQTKTKREVEGNGGTLSIVIAIPQKPRPTVTLPRENGKLGDLLKEMSALAGCEVQ